MRSRAIRKRCGSEAAAHFSPIHLASVPTGAFFLRASEPMMKYEPSAKIFTVDIDGKPTVSFEVLSAREANELVKEHWFRDDLRALKSDGLPLWDGVASLRSRPADEHETERYQGIAAAADDAAGDILLAFLVTLDGAPR